MTGKAYSKQRGAGVMVIFWLVAGLLLVGLAGFAVQVVAANRAAPKVFGPDFCWLRQGADVHYIKELELATGGFFVPNPFGQINRRYIGIGLDDPEVRSPHFAILAPDGEDVRLAGWSYRSMSFWQENQETLRQFASVETRAACRARLGR